MLDLLVDMRAVRAELVSVIIPCHNYAQYLGQAIESALTQTHQPIEVVVVDDGSLDETAAVAARYPVKLLSQPCRGVCIATNAGVRASSGEFVLRLDADDYLAATYVEETLAALVQTPEAHFAYTEVAYFGAATGSYPVEEFDPDSLAERNYIHASALMRRASFERVEGYHLNMTGARYEDWDLWLSFAERGMRGVLVRKPLLYYRQHHGVSRGRLDLFSISGLRREIVMASRLQDNHPSLFAPVRLLQRLQRLPRRLRQGEVSVRFALLLVSFYGLMLMRRALGLCAAGRGLS